MARLTLPSPDQSRTPAKARKAWQAAAVDTGLRLVREGPAPAPSHYPVKSPRDVFTFMEGYASREVAETMWVLCLNAQHAVIASASVVITRGILNSSLVHPREVFRAAIVAGAAAVILCHNHPSGDPAPSFEDEAITNQLVAAGKLLGLPVHDHIIIGEARYVSFAETGRL